MEIGIGAVQRRQGGALLHKKAGIETEERERGERGLCDTQIQSFVMIAPSIVFCCSVVCVCSCLLE